MILLSDFQKNQQIAVMHLLLLRQLLQRSPNLFRRLV